MPTLRLPHNGSQWVWKVDDEQARCMLKVISARWSGERWIVKVETLAGPHAQMGPKDARWWPVDLDSFWEAVSPIGGRLEDLSNPISESQYRPMKHERA